ncbi:MAG: ISAs1 family transposase, partial [Dolichospermum sp.]
MTLFQHLDTIQDPRYKRGIRHPLPALLKAILLGFLVGQTTIENIAFYIETHWQAAAPLLGFTHAHPPIAETYRNTLKRLPPDALSQLFTQWVQSLVSDQPIVASIDGKAVRGCRTGENPRDVFMALNVFAQESQLALAQWRIEKKEAEPTVFLAHLQELVEQFPSIELFMGDAFFSGRHLYEAIRGLNRHYLIRIKGNQPQLNKRLRLWFNSLEARHPDISEVTAEKGGPVRDVYGLSTKKS